MYKSTTRISTGFSVMDEIKISNDNFNVFEAETKFNNALVTFTSPSVLSLLSYKLILHDLQDPKPFRTVKDAQKNSPFYKSVDQKRAIAMFEKKLLTMSTLTSFNPDEKQLLEFLKYYGYDYKSLSNDISVYRLQRTDYIQIEYKSENPLLSAFVANSLYDEFQRYYQSMRTQKSTESLDTLQSLMEKKKHELDSINTSLRALGVLDPTVESTSKFEQITQLESTLSDQRAKLTTQQYTLDKIKQKLQNQPAAKAVVNVNNDEMLLARRAMNDAYSEYLQSDKDPALYAKYQRLQNAYQTKVAQYGSTQRSDGTTEGVGNIADLQEKKGDLEVDIAAGKQNADALQNKIAALRSNISADASKNVEVAALLKEADLANKEYLQAKEKLNSANDVTAAVNNFRQVLSAQPAIEAEPSKKLMIVGLAGVCTLVLCILIIAVLTYLDFSIKTPEIFSKSVNLKLITMVNHLNLKHHKVADLVNAATVDSDYQPTDVRRSNVFRESIRKLRFEVETSGKKIFLFTSARKGEGKTTLIQALAYSLSHSKKKVLVIDTNFCNNDLTVQMNAEPVLDRLQTTNEAEIIEQVKGLAYSYADSNVFTIGCESGDYTPSEFLPDTSILYNLRKLTEVYDYILLEGPPLNDFSDSKELARHVDGVIAIFGADHSIKQIDTDSIHFFHSMNGKFCGAVLNKVMMDNVKLS
ncbi:exopolysaccharide transport family protein [Deminuibacter soli]|nr:AAA family ATPase [Deminuibacter soli]